VPQAFAQALKLHEQGRLAEAGQLYAAVRLVRPDHFDALQMMALVKLAASRPRPCAWCRPPWVRASRRRKSY
jgi:hypothetical protein